MSRWKPRPGRASLSDLVRNTTITERAFYDMLRKGSPDLEQLGHAREAHGTAFQHTFNRAKVMARARAEKRAPPVPPKRIDMAKRFKGRKAEE